MPELLGLELHRGGRRCPVHLRRCRWTRRANAEHGQDLHLRTRSSGPTAPLRELRPCRLPAQGPSRWPREWPPPIRRWLPLYGSQSAVQAAARQSSRRGGRVWRGRSVQARARRGRAWAHDDVPHRVEENPERQAGQRCGQPSGEPGQNEQFVTEPGCIVAAQLDDQRLRLNLGASHAVAGSSGSDGPSAASPMEGHGLERSPQS